MRAKPVIVTAALTLLALSAIAQEREAAIVKPGATPQPAVEQKPADPLDTHARQFIRKLPTDVVNAPSPKKFSSGDYVNPRTAIVMDEIRVYGQIEPEDYTGRKKPSMQKFRERLERDRPMTPAEKAQLALCFIGLCGIYGPDGIPREPTLDERSEARANQTTTQLNGQFRGTFQ